MGDTEPRALWRNVRATMVGNIAYTASQFFMLLATVRLTDEHRVGEYALALAITAPVFLLCGLKMRHVQVTDAGGINRPGEYFVVRLLTSLIALLVCAALGGIAKGSSGFALVVAVAVFKVFEAQVDVLYGVMQRYERMDLVARSLVIRGLAGAGVFASVLWQSDSILTAVTAVALLTAVMVLVEARAVKRLGVSLAFEVDSQRLRRLALVGLPLGISVAIGSLTSNMPRYFLDGLSGSASVGVFSTVAYVLVASSLVGGSAGEAAVPRLANYVVAADYRAFRRLTAQLAVFGLIFGLAGVAGSWLVGGPVLTFLFGDLYGDASRVLVILMLAATLQYVSLAVGTAIYAMRLFKVQVPLNLLGLAVAAASGYWLTAEHGIEGAAWSVAVTQLVMFIAYAAIYARKLAAHRPAAGAA